LRRAGPQSAKSSAYTKADSGAANRIRPLLINVIAHHKQPATRLRGEGGALAPDAGTHHLVDPIAMDKFSNRGMGYIIKINATSKLPSLRYTGRAASDALGVMTLAGAEVATSTAAKTIRSIG
jgi:hypothetical protein